MRNLRPSRFEATRLHSRSTTTHGEKKGRALRLHGRRRAHTALLNDNSMSSWVSTRLRLHGNRMAHGVQVDTGWYSNYVRRPYMDSLPSHIECRASASRSASLHVCSLRASCPEHWASFTHTPVDYMLPQRRYERVQQSHCRTAFGLPEVLRFYGRARIDVLMSLLMQCTYVAVFGGCGGGCIVLNCVISLGETRSQTQQEGPLV